MDFTVWPAKSKLMTMSPRVRESGFCDPGPFCLWNPESWALESRIQLKEYGIPPTTGISNLSSIEKDWNPVPGIRNPRRGIQNQGLSWITLHEASNDWHGMDRPVRDLREETGGARSHYFWTKLRPLGSGWPPLQPLISRSGFVTVGLVCFVVLLLI